MAMTCRRVLQTLSIFQQMSTGQPELPANDIAVQYLYCSFQFVFLRLGALLMKRVE